MKKEIENFINLFSDDKKIVYEALLEKKDLINNYFYADYSFTKHLENGKEIYDDLFSLLNRSLLFKENDNFAYRYFNKNPKYIKKEGHFIVKFNFAKIDEQTYKDFFANFYPCIKNEDKVIFKEEIMNKLFSLMISNDFDYVLILDKYKLINNAYPINVIDEILYDKNYLTKDKIETLKEISQNLNVKLKEIING